MILVASTVKVHISVIREPFKKFRSKFCLKMCLTANLNLTNIDSYFVLNSTSNGETKTVVGRLNQGYFVSFCLIHIEY